MASDEQLQILNEELAASQLELESANLELVAMNRQLERSNRELRYQSEVAAAVLKAVSVPTVVVAKGLRVVDANRAFLDTFQLKAVETLGSSLRRLPQVAPPALQERLRDTLNGGAGFIATQFEVNGRWIAASCQRVEVPPHEGQTPVAVCSLEDITERKRGRRRLEAQIEGLGSAATGLLLLDDQLRVTYANPALHAIIAVAGLLERNPGLRAAARRRQGEADGELRGEDGSAVAVHWRVSAIGAGGALIEIRDTSRERRIRDYILASEKLAATGQMAAVLAHEINNPLGVVTNTCYVLRQSRHLSPQDQHLLQLASEELARVAHIVKSTLGLYREADSGAPTSATAAIESAIELMAPRLRKEEIEVARRRRAPVSVAMPASDLRQILANLLGNAADAIAAANGKPRCVSVACYATACHGRPGARLIVCDTGSGIETAVRSEIFRPFFTTKATRGTGLGLWVSAELARQHGGELRVMSWTRAPAGTCFALCLPAA